MEYEKPKESYRTATYDTKKKSSLEVGANPFSGESELEVTLQDVKNDGTEMDKGGIICVFYICHLPFVKC